MKQDLTEQCIVHVELKIMCDSVEFRAGKNFFNKEDACDFLEEIENRFVHFIQQFNWDCNEDRDSEEKLTWFTIHHAGVIDPKKYSIEGWVDEHYFHL